MRPTIEDETRCVVDGVEYHAVTQRLCYPERSGEQVCAFFYDIDVCRKHGLCTRRQRADRSNVIWVRAE